jgi:hypothetical protein
MNSDAESTTPKISLLLSKIQRLNNDLQKNMNRLVLRLDHLGQEPIVLSPSPQNIVDRKKEKERHLKSYKVNLKDVLDSVIDYDEQLG